MHRRVQNPRIAKLHRCYDVDEVMKLYDCHRNTVYNWMKHGLRPIDDHYPILFHGSSLNEFHLTRRSRNKRPCGPGQIYCVSCGEAQDPAGGMVECAVRTPLTWAVSAICPGCGRLIHRIVGKAQLADFEASWPVTFLSMKNALG